VLKDHIYEYERVIVGGDLNAVKKAYETSSYFIDNSDRFIFPFDSVDNVSDLGIEYGSAQQVWDHFSYSLSEQGLNSVGKSVFSINIDPENSSLQIITKEFSKITIRYGSLNVLSLQNVYGAPPTQVEFMGYRVFDWFDVKSGAKHEHEVIESPDKFCKKIYFYLSSRIMGNKKYKDLVAESSLTEEELSSVNFSSTIAGFKTKQMMKDAGILGTGHGSGKFRPIRLEFNRRDIIKNELIIYKKEGNIELGTRS
tara:strand:+ start:1081 stop:1842 length:762 start_codon:yes stop_codon:yes gene_type:complete